MPCAHGARGILDPVFHGCTATGASHALPYAWKTPAVARVDPLAALSGCPESG